MSTTLSTTPAIPTAAPALPRFNPFTLWTSSFLIYFAPRRTALRWRSVSLPSAVAVAFINLLLLIPWVAYIAASWLAYDFVLLRQNNSIANPFVAHPLDAYLAIFPQLPHHILKFSGQLDTSSRFGLSASAILSVLSLLIITFFVLLPFAARPGDNKACLRHTARATLLATGCIHLFAPPIGGLFLLLIFRKTVPYFENAMNPLLLLLSALTLWALVALIRAVRTDYRQPHQLPQPRDPTCDLCGYDLRGSPLDGRCPECGKPVQESLGQQYRQPTAWETHPSFFRLPIILAQLRQLVFAPRSLFYNMPTRDGQLPAQRWLLGSVTLVGAIAFWVIPGLWAINVVTEWWSGLLTGGLALAFVWAILALMMVGIETLGVVTYGRFRGIRIELAAAAKTTCYSSTLMALWAFLGGIQMLALIYFYWFNIARHMSTAYSPRLTEGLAVGSLAAAHIAGLLWFELTVYRGVRAIQYANR